MEEDGNLSRCLYSDSDCEVCNNIVIYGTSYCPFHHDHLNPFRTGLSLDDESDRDDNETDCYSGHFPESPVPEVEEVPDPSIPDISVAEPIEKKVPKRPTLCQAPGGHCHRRALENGYCKHHRRLGIPKCTVREDTVRGLLTRNYISCGSRSWFLLSKGDMQKCWTDTECFRRGEFPKCPDLEFDPDEHPEMGDFYTINRMDTDFQDVSAAPEKDWGKIEERTKVRLALDFPWINELLQEFEGRLIAAGGAVFKALLNTRGWHDIDLFFIDPEVERTDVSDAVKVQKATDQLFEAISLLADRWFQFEGNGDGDGEVSVYVTRNEFVVTVYLFENGLEYHKYQFVLRVYPSIGHVLGGFDLGAAMIAYDGFNILATELGAWSAMGRILIADISRRSTSFEHRLDKYSRYCHIVIPGLSRTVVPEQTKEWLDKEDVITVIDDAVAERDYRWGVVNVQDLMKPDYEPIYEFVKTSARCNEDEMRELLEKAARECGYILKDLSLTPVNPDVALETDEDVRDQEIEEVYTMITQLAFENGWLFRRDSYRQSKNIEYKQSAPDVRLSYLDRRPEILHLRMVDIKATRFMPYGAGKWTIRPTKDPRIKYEYTDYEGDEMIIVKEGIKEVGQTDYEDNTVWPVYSTVSNLNMLLSGNLKGVTALICFKNASTAIPLGKVNQFNVIAALGPCVFNIDEPHPSIKMSRRERIIDILKTGAVSPNIGRVEELWESRIALYSEGRSSDILQQQLFGKGWNHTHEFFSLGRKDERRKEILDGIAAPLLETIKTNAGLVQQNLVGIRWILRNPGTQWSSSLNPTIGNPREWYGEQYYRSWRIGCEEIETTLRLIRRRGGNVLSAMDYNLFRIVVREVIWAHSFLSR